MHQPRQAFGQAASGRPRSEIRGHFRFAKGLQSDLVTQLMNQEVLLEHAQRMFREYDVHWTVRGDHHQSGGCSAASKRRDDVHRGVVHPLDILESQQQWTV